MKKALVLNTLQDGGKVYFHSLNLEDKNGEYVGKVSQTIFDGLTAKGLLVRSGNAFISRDLQAQDDDMADAGQWGRNR
jgi:sporulation protein YlmC with PRC-barrel domain